MTVRFSTGTRNAQAQSLGWGGALNRGYMEVYSGAQPATADSAVGGATKLGIVTKASGALTKETRASATLTVTAAGASTLATCTVGTVPLIPDAGSIAWLTDAATTAALICDAINRNGMAEATVSAAIITIKPRPGVGAAWNGLAVAATGITCTGSSFAGGVASVNSLILSPPVAGLITKNSDVWSFNGLAAGTAGWFRFYCGDTADSGALLTAAPWYPRFDGACGVGSGDAQLSTLSITLGGPVTVDVFKMTFPAQ